MIQTIVQGVDIYTAPLCIFVMLLLKQLLMASNTGTDYDY